MSVKVLIQARMSSKRLPGKVLMPFKGKPIIQNVVDAVGVDRAIVLTSDDPSDDILAEYLNENNIPFYRGDLNNVLSRFCGAIEKFKPDWVVRICADSPMIPKCLIDSMCSVDRSGADLVTNVFPRSFPKGHSVEVIKAQTLMNICKRDLSADEKEHVTAYFYKNEKEFNIVRVIQETSMNDKEYAVDTQEDYDRLVSLGELDIEYTKSDWNIVRDV